MAHKQKFRRGDVIILKFWGQTEKSCKAQEAFQKNKPSFYKI